MNKPEHDFSNTQQNTSKNEVDFEIATTPYTRSKIEMYGLVDKALSEPGLVYLSALTNPEIGNFSILKLEGATEYADLGRTVEADVFKEHAGYPPEFIEANFGTFDQNSIFLLLVDQNEQDRPKIAGALRIIDCSQGESETINFFHECFGEDASVPQELTLGNSSEKGPWDIMTIVMYPEYRDGVKSAWLYHALYRHSLEEGVDRWITNITPKEINNLRGLIGIPFQEVPGVEPVEEPSPVIEGEKSVYGFYSIDVNNIFSEVSSKIISREKNNGATQQRMASLARIALLGHTSHENK